MTVGGACAPGFVIILAAIMWVAQAQLVDAIRIVVIAWVFNVIAAFTVVQPRAGAFATFLRS